MEPRIWLIAGPTASGKSALALRLAERLGGEIVGADSMQIYRGLEVLTAAPTPQQQARVPHHLVGIADPAEAWSAGRWLRAALKALAAIAERGRPAVVVGGTGLYFEALTRGLAEIPPAPPEVRRAAAAEFEARGEAAFRARLAEHDPAAAGRIAAGDRQRLVRAWEVLAASGRALSDWQAATRPALDPAAWRGIALEPPRTVVYARCDARLEAMAREGAVEEAATLAAQGLDPALPAMKAVGVREFAACARGETSLDKAILAAQAETRRYAKRQLTWMRARLADWPRIADADAADQWAALKAIAGRET